MPTFEALPPDPDLFESMRAVGYSLETAIADLIDNSIAAKAKEVRVLFSLSPAPYVAIVDDGEGMDKSELRVAMKLAGKPPTIKRQSHDLGRFGLGLKTASLSQARRLIVISSKGQENVVGAVWDLDEVAKRGEWSLEWLETSAIFENLKGIGLAGMEKGTAVIWQNLDMLFGDELPNAVSLSERMASTRDHLSLVFHRYLSGLPNDTVKMFLNGEKLKAIDPFFTRNPATQVKKQSIKVSGIDVDVTAYVLPNLNRMSSEELAEAKKLHSRFRDTQGFYIYRQKRLLMFGTWFRLAPRSELSKLSRVQVDTPNTLDKQWKLGVTKSQVEPPDVLRRALASLVPSIVNESQKVLGKTPKSQKPNVRDAHTYWDFEAVSADTFNLVLNKGNAVLAALISTMQPGQLSILSSYLDSIEDNFPIKELYARMVGDEVPAKEVLGQSEIIAKARDLYIILKRGLVDPEETFRSLLLMEPYVFDPLLSGLLEENKALVQRESQD